MPISTAIATAATRRRSVWRSRALLSTWTCASDGIGTEAAAARTSATTAAASRPLMSATTSTLRMTWSCTMEAGSGATLSLATSPRRTCSPEGVDLDVLESRGWHGWRRSQDHHVEDLGLLVEVADRQARSQGGCLAPDVPRPQPVALGGSEVDLDPDGRLHGGRGDAVSARRPRRRGRRDGGLCGPPQCRQILPEYADHEVLVVPGGGSGDLVGRVRAELRLDPGVLPRHAVDGGPRRAVVGGAVDGDPARPR